MVVTGEGVVEAGEANESEVDGSGMSGGVGLPEVGGEVSGVSGEVGVEKRPAGTGDGGSASGVMAIPKAPDTGYVARREVR